MTRRSLIFAVTLLLLAALPADAGEVLDRIVATVNGHIILQSDWDDAVRSEAFFAGRTLDQVTAADRKGALDRLIDQELLREQTRSSDFHPVSAQEVAKRVQEIRRQYPGAESDSAWQATLHSFGLTANQLQERVARQLNLMRLIDARLRPGVNIDQQSIERYYNQELLPRLRQSGAKAAPLAEVSSKIKQLLTERKVNELLTPWLQNLRAGSDIRNMSRETASEDQAR